MSHRPTLTDDECAQLIDSLRTGDRLTRERAADGLKRADGWDLLRLQPILDHPHVSRRAKAVEVLAAHKGPVAAALLVARLDDPDWLIRQKAVRALAKVGAVGRELVAEALANSEEGPQRLAMLEAACRLGDSRALAPVFALASDRSPSLRATAVRLLQRLGALAPSAVFVAALSDPEAVVREAAVDVMGRMQRPDCLAALVERLLAEPTRSISVYQAIRKHGDRAVDALVAAAAAATDGEPRARIAEALHGCLADQSARMRVPKLWARREPAVRDACLLLFGGGYARGLDPDLRMRLPCAGYTGEVM